MLGQTKIVDHFVEQAKWCNALGSPFTAALQMRFASDFEAGGPIANICGDWATNPRKDALGLRLAGALHHAVLSGASPALAAVYPKSGAKWDMNAVWPVAKDWLAANVEPVRAFIQSPPQTNGDAAIDHIPARVFKARRALSNAATPARNGGQRWP